MAANAVNKSLMLACSADQAFKVFTEQMGRWWPPAHHIGAQPFREIRIDRHAGGRWYEVDANGNTCPWGYVLAIEPPRVLRLAWHLSVEFEFDPDPDHASEVEVRFIELGPSSTQFEFEHRHLERHGDGWEQLREAVNSPNGWTGIFHCYQNELQANS